MPKNQPEIKGCEQLFRGQHLGLDLMTWITPSGEQHRWERASRLGQRQSVVVIARLRPSGRYVLIRQFRPPVEDHVWEFPAGLLDDGEDFSQAALRELREETGYTGQIERVLSPRTNSPGMISEASALALVNIDETSELNRHPEQRLEGSEALEVVLMSPDEARRMVDDPGHACDAKLSTYFLGTSVGRD